MRYIGIGVVAAMPFNVSLSMRSMPLLPYCLMQQLPMDRSLHLLDCLLQLRCSGITTLGLHSILLMDWLRIIGRVLYVPLEYWLQRLPIPLASMLNGPVVNGVTLVLVVVAAMLNVSFVNAFNAVTTVLFDATVTDGSFTASIGLFTTTTP
jgi:hypothetical protein